MDFGRELASTFMRTLGMIVRYEYFELVLVNMEIKRYVYIYIHTHKLKIHIYLLCYVAGKYYVFYD